MKTTLLALSLFLHPHPKTDTLEINKPIMLINGKAFIWVEKSRFKIKKVYRGNIQRYNY